MTWLVTFLPSFASISVFFSLMKPSDCQGRNTIFIYMQLVYGDVRQLIEATLQAEPQQK